MTSLGLQKGGSGVDFAGDFGTKGCYAYETGTYAGMAYYGTGGTDEQAKAQFAAHLYEKYTIYRPMGYDCERNF